MPFCRAIDRHHRAGRRRQDDDAQPSAGRDIIRKTAGIREVLLDLQAAVVKKETVDSVGRFVRRRADPLPMERGKLIGADEVTVTQIKSSLDMLRREDKVNLMCLMINLLPGRSDHRDELRSLTVHVGDLFFEDPRGG